MRVAVRYPVGQKNRTLASRCDASNAAAAAAAARARVCIL